MVFCSYRSRMIGNVCPAQRSLSLKGEEFQGVVKLNFKGYLQHLNGISRASFLLGYIGLQMRRPPG